MILNLKCKWLTKCLVPDTMCSIERSFGHARILEIIQSTLSKFTQNCRGHNKHVKMKAPHWCKAKSNLEPCTVVCDLRLRAQHLAKSMCNLSVFHDIFWAADRLCDCHNLDLQPALYGFKIDSTWMWTLKMFLPRDVFWDVCFSICSAFSNGAFENLSRTTMLIKALELNFKTTPQPRMAGHVSSVCVWVCPDTASAKQHQFNMHCHYTDGQKRVVSVPWQYLLTDIVHYAKSIC